MRFQRKNGTLLAVADGWAMPLSAVPDEAFSSGMLGVGFAIEPTAGTIYSPVNGSVDSVTETGHAYTIVSEDGLDILVHVGIDTVQLKGEGFLPMVQKGDRIKKGDVLARVDLERIKKSGLPLTVPVLITSPEEIKITLSPPNSPVIGGKTAVLQYRLE